MASGTGTIYTGASHIDEIYLDGVQHALEFGIVIAPRVDRSWDFVGHGDTYKKQRIPNIESQTKIIGTDLTPNVYTDINQVVVIDWHQACAIRHDNLSRILTRIDVMEEMQKRMGYALARAIDVNLATIPQNFTQTKGTYGVELTYDDLLDATLDVEVAGYDMGEGMTWMISPAQRVGFLKMDTFIHADYVGEDRARSASERAKLGLFQQAEIVVSNLLRSPASGQHDNFLFHKETIALIMAKEPSVTTEKLALALSDVVVMDQVYGFSEILRYSETPGNVTPINEGAVLLKGV